jgi:hypothetical protein
MDMNAGTDPGRGLPGAGGPPVSDVIVPTGPEKHPTRAAELLRAEARDVRADTVEMERAGAEFVTAERVVMNNSGARTIDARSAQIDRSGVLAVRSDKAVFSNSSAIGVAVEEARFVRSRVFLLKTDQATIDAETRIGLYAGPASAYVRPVLDIRGAAAFGAACGAVTLLLGTVLRRTLRRG